MTTTTTTTSSLLFSYTGVPQTFVVPRSVLFVKATVKGAAGGSGNRGGGGRGGTGTTSGFVIPVVPGEELNILVGGSGDSGGFNGGGTGGAISRLFNNFAGRGGGASEIRRGTTPLFVAGGGGGGASGPQFTAADLPFGGDGGGSANGAKGGPRFRGEASLDLAGLGGKQNEGGAGGDSGNPNRPTAGSRGQGGTGADPQPDQPVGGSSAAGGGGGGGYYGGGGGGSQTFPDNRSQGGGGGGGSGYALDSFSRFVSSGTSGDAHGSVLIEWSRQSQCARSFQEDLQSLANQVDTLGTVIAPAEAAIFYALQLTCSHMIDFINVNFADSPCCVGAYIPLVSCALPLLAALREALLAFSFSEARWPNLLDTLANALRAFQACFPAVCDDGTASLCASQCEAGRIVPQFHSDLINILRGVLIVPMFFFYGQGILRPPIDVLEAERTRVANTFCFRAFPRAFNGDVPRALETLIAQLTSEGDRARVLFVQDILNKAYAPFVLCSDGPGPETTTLTFASPQSDYEGTVRLNDDVVPPTGQTYIRSTVLFSGGGATGKIRFQVTDTETGVTYRTFTTRSGVPTTVDYVVPVPGAVIYTGPFFPVVKTTQPGFPWVWSATYEGDYDHAPSTTPTDDPYRFSIVEKATPRLRCVVYPSDSTLSAATTTTTPPLSLGCSIVGGHTPAGFLQFTLYGPMAAGPAGVLVADQILSTSVIELRPPSSSSTVPRTEPYFSAPYTPTVPGQYFWRVTYLGDGNNHSVVNVSSDLQLDEGYEDLPVRGRVSVGPFTRPVVTTSSGSPSSSFQKTIVLTPGFETMESTVVYAVLYQATLDDPTTVVWTETLQVSASCIVESTRFPAAGDAAGYYTEQITFTGNSFNLPSTLINGPFVVSDAIAGGVDQPPSRRTSRRRQAATRRSCSVRVQDRRTGQARCLMGL